MRLLRQSLIIGLLGATFFAQFGYAQDFDSEFAVANQTNNSFGIELNYTYLPLKPQIFLAQSTNESKSNQMISRAPNIGVFKGFALSSSIFTVSNLSLTQIAEKGLLLAGVSREYDLQIVQFSQQFGFNILSKEFDGATLHPFIGFGAYLSEGADRYGDKEAFGKNSVSEQGALIEMGVMFINQANGLYSTFKAGAFVPQTFEVTSDQVSLPELVAASNLQPQQSDQMRTYFSLGFGIKF